MRATSALRLLAVTLLLASCSGKEAPTEGPQDPAQPDPLIGTWSVTFRNMFVNGSGSCTLTPITINIWDNRGRLGGSYTETTLTCPYSSATKLGGAISNIASNDGLVTIEITGTPYRKSLDGTLAQDSISGSAYWVVDGSGLLVTGYWDAVRR